MVFSVAAAQGLPSNMSGFTAMEPRLVAGGELQRILQQESWVCSQEATYRYTQAQAATQGLQNWYSSQKLVSEGERRSDNIVAWMASNDNQMVVGLWNAPKGGQPGSLELCLDPTERQTSQSSGSRHTHIRIPFKLIALLLAGLGGLGSGLSRKSGDGDAGGFGE